MFGYNGYNSENCPFQILCQVVLQDSDSFLQFKGFEVQLFYLIISKSSFYCAIINVLDQGFIPASGKTTGLTVFP
jgi:hypothetical protein